MTAYSVNLGFDWNAVQNNNGPLQACLMDKDGNTPAWYNFDKGDTIFFTLYDITSLNGGTSVNSPTLSFEIEINNTDLTGSPQPLTPTASYSIGNSSILYRGMQSSRSFGKACPSWAIGSNKPNSAGLIYKFSESGRFNLTLTVTVQPAGSSVTNTYVYDPEMVIGPST
jgi:hypothetical protein